MTDLQTAFGELGDAYDRIDEILRWPDELLLRSAPAVSDWSAGQHIHHLSNANRVIARSISGLVSSQTEADSDRRLNLLGITVLSTDLIPRGVASAPARLHPPDILSREEIADAVKASLKSVDSLQELGGIIVARRSRLRHPYLGYLRSSQWLRFMNVHTSHHLRIVRHIEETLRSMPEAGDDPSDERV